MLAEKVRSPLVVVVLENSSFELMQRNIFFSFWKFI
jgi:hypothetical protein